MEKAYEYSPGETTRTKLWITKQGKREMKIVHLHLRAFLEAQATKGFQEYEGKWLRPEGQGTWAYGTDRWTTRISGYFKDDKTRKDFVICGVWEGKTKRGNKRPKRGNTVANRTASIKTEGVEFVKESEVAEGTDQRSEDTVGQDVLRAEPEAGPSDTHHAGPEADRRDDAAQADQDCGMEE